MADFNIQRCDFTIEQGADDIHFLAGLQFVVFFKPSANNWTVNYG